MMKRSEDLFLDNLDQSVAKIIKQALIEVDKFNVDKALQILEPLIKKKNEAALFYAASLSSAKENQESFEKRQIEQLQESASLGYAPAIHELAICYDSGDLVGRDALKAAKLFKEAAQKGHPHSQWIHGEDLLYGRNGIKKNELLGLEYIKKSADARFEGALETIVKYYKEGVFGFSKDLEKARVIIKQIEGGDIVGY